MGSQAVLDEVGRRSTMTPESSSFLHGYSHAQGLRGLLLPQELQMQGRTPISQGMAGNLQELTEEN